MCIYVLPSSSLWHIAYNVCVCVFFFVHERMSPWRHLPLFHNLPISYNYRQLEFRANLHLIRTLYLQQFLNINISPEDTYQTQQQIHPKTMKKKTEKRLSSINMTFMWDSSSCSSHTSNIIMNENGSMFA